MGEVVLSAWTDQDGEGQTKQPGDVMGEVITKIPDESLRVVLDTVVTVIVVPSGTVISKKSSKSTSRSS